MEIFVHSTTRNAPYVHTKLDSSLELCRAFPNDTTYENVLSWYEIKVGIRLYWKSYCPYFLNKFLSIFDDFKVSFWLGLRQTLTKFLFF